MQRFTSQPLTNSAGQLLAGQGLSQLTPEHQRHHFAAHFDIQQFRQLGVVA